VPKPNGTEVFGRPNANANPNGFDLGPDHAGMCKAMTSNWIKLAKQHGLQGSSAVMDGNQLLMTSIVQAGFLRKATRFALLNAGLDTNDELYSQYSLKKVRGWTSNTPLTGGDLFNRMRTTLESSGSAGNAPYFWELRSSAHSMGFCYDPAGPAVYLFDPNYGLYQANTDEQIRQLLDHIQNYRGGDTPSWNYMIIDSTN
jgi:hypothetical protein